MSSPEFDNIIPFSRIEAKRVEHNMPIRELILLGNLAHDMISAPPPPTLAHKELQGELNEHGVDLKALREALGNIKF